MTRRADHERIYLARRATLLADLMKSRFIDELECEHLILAWEREAEGRGLDRCDEGFWVSAMWWIAERRANGSP